MATLERVPGTQNWIERLNPALRAAWKRSWIHRAAEHLAEPEGTMSVGRAIAVAVNAAKRGCATGDLNFRGPQEVNPKSRAEMCAAVTLWESMKAAAKTETSIPARDRRVIELAFAKIDREERVVELALKRIEQDRIELAKQRRPWHRLRRLLRRAIVADHLLES